MLKVLVCLAAAFWACAAVAADKPRYGPPASWVKPLAIPDLPPSQDGAGTQTLLIDGQSLFGAREDQRYFEAASRVLSSQGLAEAGTFSIPWTPDTQTLTVHKIHILRGGQVIDVLAGGKKLTVLRRETSLERAMLDGALTATIQLEDLRVGDVVDVAMTLSEHDPVMQGRSETQGWLRYPGVIGRGRFRALWPAGKSIRWWVSDDLPKPTLTQTADGLELTIDLAGVMAAKPPQDAPTRFRRQGEVQLSQFDDWSQVSALVAPLYAKAATLAPDSPLKAEAAKIKAKGGDAKAQAAAALKLVEEQIRYVFLGMNFAGVIPAEADVTWSRRFADCKGKSVLLVALLHELGIEAQAAMVSSTGGDGLDQRLPMLAVFDHVIVRAVIGGKVYWLDGTRLGDRDIDSLPPQPFHWALPIQAAGAKLEKLELPPYAEPQDEWVMRLDASAGLDTPAPARVEHIRRGDSALIEHLALAALTRADAERYLREAYSSSYPWITVARVGFGYDEASGVARTWMEGDATMDWLKSGAWRSFDIGESNLGFKANFKREPGPNRDAPFTVSYPRFAKWTVRVTLPGKGAGFSLTNAPDVDTTIAGVAYWRRSRIEDGVAIMEATERSLAPEFPASEAKAAETALRDLSETNVYITARTSLMASDDTPDPADAVAPTDAAGFVRRAANFMEAKDYDHAIADLGRAAQLEPKVGKHLYNRGVAHYLKGEDDLAQADFSRALALNPGDVLALMGRARIRLIKGDEVGAGKDYEEAVRRSPGDADILARRADAYASTGRFEAAVRFYDQLIARFPTDKKADEFLAERCLAKGRWGKQMEGGLADCDAALKLSPDSGDILQKRGFVNLRLGRFDAAVADYGAAIDQSLKPARPLYGRGLAELRKGLKAQGEADIAAAKAKDPKVEAGFAPYGLVP